MLQQYKDINGHCVCFADASTGLVEHKCKGICTRTKIPYGGEYSIEKGDTITILKRVNDRDFVVKTIYRKTS